MLTTGFEPAVPASKRLQIHARARTNTGIGEEKDTAVNNTKKFMNYYYALIFSLH
jgi:hypothetical protein